MLIYTNSPKAFGAAEVVAIWSIRDVLMHPNKNRSKSPRFSVMIWIIVKLKK